MLVAQNRALGFQDARDLSIRWFCSCDLVLGTSPGTSLGLVWFRFGCIVVACWSHLELKYVQFWVLFPVQQFPSPSPSMSEGHAIERSRLGRFIQLQESKEGPWASPATL